MNRRQRIIVSVTGIFIVLLILIGLTYGYFLTRITGNSNPNSISVTTADLNLVYSDGDGDGDGIADALVTADKVMPGTTLPSKVFNVTNTGTATVKYSVIIENMVNNFERASDWIYTLERNGEEVVATGILKKREKQTLLPNITIEPKVTHTYKLKVTYTDPNQDQTIDMGKSLSFRVNIVEKYDFNEIFEDLNIVQNSSFEDPNNSLVVYAGSPEITSKTSYGGNNSLKTFGTSSQQLLQRYKPEEKTENITYYVACKARLDRYVQGGLGIFVSDTVTKETKSISQTTVTNQEFVTISDLVETSGGELALFYGSYSSANIDGYVDDIVIIPLSKFDTTPSKEELDILYEKYVEPLKFIDGKNIKTFISAMNAKAASLSMSNSYFEVPSGAGYINQNYTTARDMMKLFVEASKSSEFIEISKSDSVIIDIAGPNAREEELISTMDSSFKSSYNILGEKTGSWDNVYNLGVISEINGNTVIGITLGSNSNKNRFNAMKELLDIATLKLANESYDTSMSNVFYSESAIACIVKGDSFEILFEQNADEKFTPASITKVLTLLTALDYVDDNNITIEFKSIDLVTGSGAIFKNGDIITLEDAFYAMMLPSSNQAAQAIARVIGEKIDV